MQDWLEQQGLLAGFIVACAENDPDLLGKTLKDVIVEPQRKGAVPCFDAVKEAAMKSGAFGCSLSGSGPSMFALCRSSDARNIASKMEQACRLQGIACQSWVSSMMAPGACIESA
jgi:homoserine kinase